MVSDISETSLAATHTGEHHETNGELAPGPTLFRFLRSFQVLLHSVRLYQRNHPHIHESLETTERNLRAALRVVSPLTIGIERGALLLPSLPEHPVADQRAEFSALGQELARCGITSLVFLPQTNLGELDTLARLLNDALLTVEAGSRNGRASEPSSSGRGLAQAQGQNWRVRLARHHIFGIRANTPIERKVDTALASMLAALFAYGRTSPEASGDSVTASSAEKSRMGNSPASLEELSEVLQSLARMASLLRHARQVSPQQAAHAFHVALAGADRRTVSLLAAAMTRWPPREDELHTTYVARLAESLALEFASEEFTSGRVTPPGLRGLSERLAREWARNPELVAAATGLGRSSTTGQAGPTTDDFVLVGQPPEEAYAERLHELFWTELPDREASYVLHSRDAWCVPIPALCRYLEQLTQSGRTSEGASTSSEGAPLGEARLVVLNYASCLSSEDATGRRAVAAGLVELCPVIERLWPHQLPGALSCGVLEALERETMPGIAGLLTAATENLARLSVARSDYAEFEHILEALECAPHDADHAHLTALAERLVADERWLLLVDAALANRALDPVLPRLLRRSPERLVDRLSLLLTTPRGSEGIPAMARLLRAIGEPAFETLQARLFEPRRQRVTAAVKLLAATHPRHLLDALPLVMPNWDWNLQDFAVSELSRQAPNISASEVAAGFLAVLAEAHPMVVPMILDHIALAQETSAVAVLLDIAAGKVERLGDVFIRIKAVEALGRMRAAEAAGLLWSILERRSGLTHVEPAGLRAAADEALALIEDRPSSARVRAAYKELERASPGFATPRRYLRIPLSSPLTAQVEGHHAAQALVRTISLGGAFLESKQRLSVGDSIRIEIRAGLRNIRSTAIVRDVTANGSGVEFVHMTQEDREKLRGLIRRLRRR